MLPRGVQSCELLSYVLLYLKLRLLTLGVRICGLLAIAILLFILPPSARVSDVDFKLLEEPYRKEEIVKKLVIFPQGGLLRDL